MGDAPKQAQNRKRGVCALRCGVRTPMLPPTRDTARRFGGFGALVDAPFK